MSEVYDNRRCTEAISKVCELMDDMGLNLYERWRVAHVIKGAARAMMLCNCEGEASRDAVERLLDVLPYISEEGDRPATGVEAGYQQDEGEGA